MSHAKNVRARMGRNLYKCPFCDGPLPVTVSAALMTKIKVDGAQTKQFTCNAGHEISVTLTTMPAMGGTLYPGRLQRSIVKALWKNGGKL